MWKKKLKKMFPWVYEEYLHIKRRRVISKASSRRNLSKEEYCKILSQQYKERIGHSLDWKNLQTYTEKMQWEKIYDDNPLKSLLADKYAVREWIAKKIGKEYLIPLLGVWNNFDEINFEKLPNQFVLKTNHGSGTNIIVKDKSKLNKCLVKQKLDDWLETDFGLVTMERHYSFIPRKILAEQYIETNYGELQDYKFLCFDGRPYFCWVDLGRYSTHTRNVYDLNWKLQPWNQEKFNHYKKPIPKPKNFEKMIDLSKILSSGFSHVRVDLYNVNGKIYFGEMTFTNGSGYDRILPEKYNMMLGKLWNIPVK